MFEALLDDCAQVAEEAAAAMDELSRAAAEAGAALGVGPEYMRHLILSVINMPPPPAHLHLPRPFIRHLSSLIAAARHHKRRRASRKARQFRPHHLPKLRERKHGRA